MGNTCLKKKTKHKGVGMNHSSKNLSVFKADQHQQDLDVEELWSNYEFLRSKGIMEKKESSEELRSNYEFLRNRGFMEKDDYKKELQLNYEFLRSRKMMAEQL